MSLIVTHMLELTEEELCGLWALLTLLDLKGFRDGNGLEPNEKRTLEKVQRLMEGR